MKVIFAVAIAMIVTNVAVAQDTPSNVELDHRYGTVAAALEGMRAKNGVESFVRSGWTVIEDRSTMSVWSFTPPGHPAHPAAIHRWVVKKEEGIFVDMRVLCEAPKTACDAVVAEFRNTHQKIRDAVSAPWNAPASR